MDAQAPYEGTYTASRNPNSTMLRVLSNAGYDINGVEVAIVSTPLPEGVESETPVRVTVEKVSGKLLREAEKAGYAFVEAESDGGHVEALFRVVPDGG